ncbi:amidohydrolase, partial [Amycolatopsis thailandensis]
MIRSEHASPTPPDDSYLRSLVDATADAVAAAEPLGSPHEGADPATRDAVSAGI